MGMCLRRASGLEVGYAGPEGVRRASSCFPAAGEQLVLLRGRSEVGRRPTRVGKTFWVNHLRSSGSLQRARDTSPLLDDYE